jgi:hypothetical protein
VVFYAACTGGELKMGAFANFFVISTAKFEEYSKMASLVPYKPAPAGTQYSVHAVSPEEQNSPEFQETMAYYKKLWDFLHKNGKEPYQYKWSGYTLDELLGWLKDAQNINLMEIKFVAPKDDEFFWLVFDESIKKKYLDQLNPAKFKAEDVISSYEHLCEQYRETAIKEMASKLSKDELKAYLAKMSEYEELEAKQCPSKKEQRVNQTNAMMDGIDILYKYMHCIDVQTVVILNIG